MKQINWNAEKNQQLMSEREVSFEDALFALQSGGLLDDGPHPNRDKYPNQRLFVIRIDDYAWLVPYVENDREIFLKTVIPSRDLEALQRRALEEGLPYQSLVSSVLHKYVSGGLKDISANKSGR